MTRKCFMCGREVAGDAILCDKCDKPRRPKQSEYRVSESAASSSPPLSRRTVAANTPLPALEQDDPFPEAPILPFPVEAASPAITSVADILAATGAAAILIGPDRIVKFVSDEARRLFGDPQADFSSVKFLESRAGIRIADLSALTTSAVRVEGRGMQFTLVPISGGAGGAALIFRDPPAVVQPAPAAPSLTTVSEVVRRVADRFAPLADLKGVQVQIDSSEVGERFRDHESLQGALAVLMENALHYVPKDGMIVIGVRMMEHKGQPLLLFFVMDNGPLVPEHLRQSVFESSFEWNPASPERTGRGLFRARQFASAHSGTAWVESKSGKACTFFLRIRPDGAQ